MSQSQKWPLSQNAHKSSGECSVCHAVRQLHDINGTVHCHGPRNNPCPCSDKPPATVRPYVLPTTLQQSAASSATTGQQIDVSASISSIPGIDPAPADGFSHPQLVRRCIKHIPKSARPACAQRYAELLRRCKSNPHNLHAWEELLNFGKDVLAQPTRGGKRHNLASIIEKRTIQPCTADHEIVSHKTKSTDAALYWPMQSLPRSRTGTSELLSESCVPKISRRRTRTACTHNWSTSTRHLCQIEVPFQIHNQRWLLR